MPNRPEYAAGRLLDDQGYAVHTTSAIPVEQGWLRTYWPAVVRHDGRHFFDTRRFDGGLRVYREAPDLRSHGE